MTIEFSIITVTKNNLNGLIQTAESVSAQTYRNFEWIIIDGNSSDGSKDYIETLFAISVTEEDTGIYDAMNKGIDRSHGDYIIFMNAGDCFSDIDILGTISKAIKAEQPDFIYGDALETNGHYKKARWHEKLHDGMFTHHQAMIYRREQIGNLRYNLLDYGIAADYDFTCSFLKRAKIISYIPAALCLFETGGISQQRQRAGRKEEFMVRKKMGIPFFKNSCVYLRQSGAATIKKISPKLYHCVRR